MVEPKRVALRAAQEQLDAANNQVGLIACFFFVPL
jgi:hypothetical protein